MPLVGQVRHDHDLLLTVWRRLTISSTHLALSHCRPSSLQVINCLAQLALEIPCVPPTSYLILLIDRARTLTLGLRSVAPQAWLHGRALRLWRCQRIPLVLVGALEKGRLPLSDVGASSLRRKSGHGRSLRGRHVRIVKTSSLRIQLRQGLDVRHRVVDAHSRELELRMVVICVWAAAYFGLGYLLKDDALGSLGSAHASLVILIGKPGAYHEATVGILGLPVNSILLLF